MITLYTIKELHQLAGRLQAVRQRLETESTAGVSPTETALKVSLSEASVALYRAVREVEELSKEQQKT